MTVLSPEMQALVAGLRGRAPERPDLDWTRLEQLAMAHGVVPLLHRAWALVEDLIPATVLSDLAVVRRQSQKDSLLGLRQRDEVLKLLRNAGVHALTLKGAAWARSWYSDISLRPFRDIDLLIPIHDIPPAREALLSAGYKESGVLGLPHHDMPFEHSYQPLKVELHRFLHALPTSRDLRFEDFVDRSITLGGKDALVRTLCQEDTLMHLCAHLLQHLACEPGWRLLNVWDIVRHIESSSLSWDLFGERIRRADLSAACCAALGLVVVLTGAVIPGTYCDIQAGNRLAAFPFMRYSSSAFRHQGAISLIDVLSHWHHWHTIPGLVGGMFRHKFPDVEEAASDRESLPMHESVSSVRYVSKVLWWVMQESLRWRTGQVYYGIRRLRWEEQAQGAVYDLVRLPQQIEHGRPIHRSRDIEEREWPTTP